MNKIRLVITGGAGFIGSNAVEYFYRSKDYAVRSVVDKITYAADPYRIEKLQVPLYFWDISSPNEASWDSMLANHLPDVVINFAAESHVDRSIETRNYHNFFSSNYIGVGSLLTTLRTFQSRRKRKMFFLQISTDEVLGDTDFNSTEEFSEEAKLCPSNVYAATKAAAELLIKSMHRTYSDFDYSIVRATNNYGPYQHSEKFLSVVINKMLERKRIPVYGRGENIREWLWVGDFVEGLDKLIKKYYEDPGVVNKEVFHFGSGVRHTNLETIKAIASVTRVPAEVEFVEDRPGHDRRYALNCEKAKKVLDWKPKMQFEDGLKKVVESMINKNGIMKGN